MSGGENQNTKNSCWCLTYVDHYVCQLVRKQGPELVTEALQIKQMPAGET